MILFKMALLIGLSCSIICGDCYLNCYSIYIQKDFESCLNNCDQKYIIGFTILGAFVFMVGICVVCYCKGKKCYFRYIEYRRLYELYNHTNSGLMSKKYFYANHDSIIQVLLTSANINNFYFSKGDKDYPMRCSYVDIQLQEDFLYRMKLWGEDYYFGKWTADGAYLCSEKGLRLWFMKSYEAKEKVVQKGLMKRVIFQGMLHNEKVYKGKWYCKGEERNAELTGEWCLIAKTVSLNVGSLNQLQDFSLEMLNK